MTYKEYREVEQQAVNELPIFWAFSNAQFKEAMEERGLTEHDTDKLYAFPGGGFYLKTDAEKIRAWVNRRDILPELMKDYDFAVDAIYYEMCNHEYGINWQKYWDVMSCFAKKELPYYDDEYSDAVVRYWNILGWEEQTRKAYLEAERKYYRAAQEGEWF